MDTLKELLTLIGVVLGIIVAAASIVAFFRVNLAKNQIEALRGDRDDLSERVDRLTDQLEEANVKSETQARVIQQQAENIKNLRDAVTGKKELAHLQSTLDAHDARVDERHNNLSRRVDDITDNQKTSNELLMALDESNKEMYSAILLFVQSGRSNERTTNS